MHGKKRVRIVNEVEGKLSKKKKSRVEKAEVDDELHTGLSQNIDDVDLEDDDKGDETPITEQWLLSMFREMLFTLQM
jgi:hypothetical protein